MINIPHSKVSKELIEKLSSAEHDQWITLVHNILSHMVVLDYGELESFEEDNHSGDNPMVVNVIIDKEVYDNWNRLIGKTYNELTEKEKDVNRVFAYNSLNKFAEFLEPFDIRFQLEEVQINYHNVSTVICNRCKTKFRFVEGTTPPLDENGLCLICRK